MNMQLQRTVTWLWHYCNNVKMWQRDIWPEWDIRKSIEQRNDGGGDILTARVTLWQCDIMCDTGTEDQLAVSVTCPLPFPVYYLAGCYHHSRHIHYHHLEYINLIFMACSSSFPAPLRSVIMLLNKNPPSTNPRFTSCTNLSNDNCQILADPMVFMLTGKRGLNLAFIIHSIFNSLRVMHYRVV